MSRIEIYPWSTLQKVGDYFVVTEDFKANSHYFMNATVAQRNKHKKSVFKYTCVKTTYGCIVMLVQIGDDVPPYDYEVVDGIYAIATAFDNTATQPLGNKPKARELTHKEKVDRLPLAVKQENLPWWYEDGKLLWNPKVEKRREDTEAYYKGTFQFGAMDPYPEFYNLGSDFRKKSDTEEHIESEEDWGEAPIIDEGGESEQAGDD